MFVNQLFRNFKYIVTDRAQEILFLCLELWFIYTVQKRIETKRYEWTPADERKTLACPNYTFLEKQESI